MRAFLVDHLAGTRLDTDARKLYLRLFRHRMSPLERRNREYDELSVAIIRKVMRRESNSVDAGAHRGYFLSHLLRSAPRGTHYAFEPIPALAAQLRARFAQATVFAAALGEQEAETSFRYLPTKPAQSSMYRREEREKGVPVEELTVPVTTLDAVWPSDLPLDFMKIDVEGAEASLLRGARQTVARSSPVVLFEVDVSNLDETTAILEEVGLTTYLLRDFLANRTRSRGELLDVARAEGEWFFAARRS